MREKSASIATAAVIITLLLVAVVTAIPATTPIATSPSALQQTTQKTQMTWAKSYGGKNYEVAYDVAVDKEGNIIVAGYTSSFGAGELDIWVLKLSSNGTPIWQKTYGGTGYDDIWDIAIDDSGNIIVAGETYSFGAGWRDAWVLKLNKDGDILWQATYGAAGNESAQGVAVDKEGNIIVAGYTSSFGAGELDIWVLKLNGEGNILWQNAYGGTDNDKANTVAVNDEGNIVIAGSTRSFGTGKSDFLVLKLNKDGEALWQATYGEVYEEDEVAFCATIDGEGNMIVAGYTTYITDDFWVLKLDKYGFPTWQKTYGGNGMDICTGVTVDGSGNIIVVGLTSSFGAGWRDAWVLKLNKENGDVMWQKTYGGEKHDEVAHVVTNDDGNIIAVGYTNSFTTGWLDADFWVLNMGSGGEIYNTIPDFAIKNTNVTPGDLLLSWGNITLTKTTTFAITVITQATVTETNATINTQAFWQAEQPSWWLFALGLFIITLSSSLVWHLIASLCILSVALSIVVLLLLRRASLHGPRST